MAYDSPNGIKLTGHVAASTLATKQYHFVKLDSSGDVVIAGNGDDAIGVLQNDPVAAEECEIIIVGVSKVSSGSTTVAVGDRLSVDAAGQAEDAVATTEFAVGKALTPASAVSEIFTAAINCISNFLAP